MEKPNKNAKGFTQYDTIDAVMELLTGDEYSIFKLVENPEGARQPDEEGKSIVTTLNGYASEGRSDGLTTLLDSGYTVKGEGEVDNQCHVITAYKGGDCYWARPLSFGSPNVVAEFVAGATSERQRSADTRARKRQSGRLYKR